MERYNELLVFTPIQSKTGRWKCEFEFGTMNSTTFQYGCGDDFLEAFLDAMSLALLVRERSVSKN